MVGKCDICQEIRKEESIIKIIGLLKEDVGLWMVCENCKEEVKAFIEISIERYKKNKNIGRIF